MVKALSINRDFNIAFSDIEALYQYRPTISKSPGIRKKVASQADFLNIEANRLVTSIQFILPSCQKS